MRALYRIDVGYACFGVLIEDTKVIETPPIARWMLGRSHEMVRRWVESKNGTMAPVA